MSPSSKWFWHLSLCTLGVSTAAFLSSTDSKGMRTLWTLWTENQKVEKETQQIKIKLGDMAKKIEAFSRNETSQERTVRLQTGYLRDNEMLIEWL